MAVASCAWSAGRQEEGEVGGSRCGRWAAHMLTAIAAFTVVSVDAARLGYLITNSMSVQAASDAKNQVYAMITPGSLARRRVRALGLLLGLLIAAATLGGALGWALKGGGDRM